MKPRNKTVELETQGTPGLPSVLFIKQALPVCYWINLFDDKNYISFSVESKWERLGYLKDSNAAANSVDTGIS